jgi:hypothetical protein
MSRGALLLRAVREDRELPYAPIAGATLTGRRARPAAQTREKLAANRTAPKRSKKANP